MKELSCFVRSGEDWLRGTSARACRVCSAERGLRPEEMIEGVESASMVDLVDWVVQSDKTMFF
jgi:sulfur relay (sulfurtransferase) complex TusBCD TusD component (DsrE family)